MYCTVKYYEDKYTFYRVTTIFVSRRTLVSTKSVFIQLVFFMTREQIDNVRSECKFFTCLTLRFWGAFTTHL